MDGYKLAIVGSRSFDDYELFTEIMGKFLIGKQIDLIISGGAKGVDTMAEHYAKVKGIQTIIHKPNWEKFGRPAAFIRNRQIVEDSNIVLSIWDGDSNGTKHSMDIAKKLGKELFVFNYVLFRWLKEDEF